MNKIFFFIILLLFPVVLLSGKNDIHGKVVKVTDGDTITILDSENKQIEKKIIN